MNTLLAIEESDLRPVLDAGIFVEPKDRDPRNEDDRQTEVVVTTRRYAPRVKVESTPNAAKRTRWAIAKAKREGLLKGSSDLKFWWNGGGHGIVEMKDGRSMPEPDQIDYLNWQHRNGHNVAVCRTWVGVFDRLRAWGAPVPRTLGL